MAYVITEPCISTCDTSCVKVCPVDCIHGPLSEREIEDIPERDRPKLLAKIQLYINPDTCIDCAACEPECPVDAIFEADAVPDKWHHYIELNAENGPLYEKQKRLT